MAKAKTGVVPNDVPLLCLSSALTQKAPISHLSSWIALSLTLDGRDKITKIIQYSCRFLTWFYTSSASSNIHANCYKSLYKSLTESRKAYRLGRTITEFHKIRNNPMFQSKETGNKKGANDEEEDSSWWRDPCAAFKLIGLAGFWLGDNLFYLTNIGFFDSKFHDAIPIEKWDQKEDIQSQVLSRRTRETTKAKHFASRCYYVAVLVGLYGNIREVLLQRKKLREINNRLRMLVVDKEFLSARPSLSHESDCKNSSDDEEGKTMELWVKEKERYFVKLVALSKSVCDTIVFSNNPGVDLHLRYRGRKMHEGLHCLFGVLSASTVIYNKLPNKKTHELSYA